MFDLIATDEDDGETDTLSWTIINQDLSAGEAFITGTGQLLLLFTYVPDWIMTEQMEMGPLPFGSVKIPQQERLILLLSLSQFLTLQY